MALVAGLTGAAAGALAVSEAVRFEDIAGRAGIHFVLRNAASPDKRLIETMTGGVAVLDYNNDGRPDIYFVNGARQPSLEKSGAEYHNRLYRNDGGWKFSDVTAEAGVAARGYSMAAAAADYDNDGFTDLFVAGVNGNILYHNRRDGTFEEAALPAGRAVWSVAGGWLDYDNDGLLDLFVVNYVAWDPARESWCGDTTRGIRTYCHPRNYEPLPNQLLRNTGRGTFVDVSASTGIAAHRGKGMAVAVADYDLDGDTDVFVTNDTVANFLFRNDRGKFREVAREAGVAFNNDGRALSSMGADFRDYDDDGRPDIFITALANETFPLFRNAGGGFFDDVTYATGVGRATLELSGWGCGMFDFDNDGRKDLFAANGDVQDNTELLSSRKSRQPNLILVRRANGDFAASEILKPPALHRGAAFADFDGDGRMDVVVTRLNDRPALLRNVTGGGNHWLALRLVGRRSNRDGLGARVRIVGASGREQFNHATTAVGYASSSTAIVHFGLGRNRSARLVEVLWPSGAKTLLKDVSGDRVVEIRE